MSRIYLKIPNIAGESVDREHWQWIEARAVHWAVAVVDPALFYRPPVRYQNLRVIKDLDVSSPRLALACARNESFAEVLLEFSHIIGNQIIRLYKIRLRHVLVSKVEIRMASDRKAAGFSIQGEEISLQFWKIQWDYTRVDENGKLCGNVVTGWDLPDDRELI